MAGLFIFKNSYIYNTSSPVFQFNETSVQIENMKGQLITCRTATQPFCIISARSGQFSLKGLLLKFTNSLQDLFLFESCSSVFFGGSSIQYVNIGSGVLQSRYDAYKLIRRDSRQIFGLRFKSVQSVIYRSFLHYPS